MDSFNQLIELFFKKSSSTIANKKKGKNDGAELFLDSLFGSVFFREKERKKERKRKRIKVKKKGKEKETGFARFVHPTLSIPFVFLQKFGTIFFSTSKVCSNWIAISSLLPYLATLVHSREFFSLQIHENDKRKQLSKIRALELVFKIKEPGSTDETADERVAPFKRDADSKKKWNEKKKNAKWGRRRHFFFGVNGRR